MSAKPTFFFIYAAAFINIVSFTMVFPLLPIYAREFNASNFEIGLLASSFALAQLLFSAFWGTLSDKYGRKPIIAIGLFGIGIWFVVFGFASHLIVLFAARFFQGLFSGATLPATRAYVADLTTKKDRVEAMGRLGAAIGLGVILGPAIGGLLSRYGLATPFFAAALVAFLNFFLVIFFLPESIKEKTKEKVRVARDIFGKLFDNLSSGVTGSLAPLFLLAFVWSFALANESLGLPLLGLEKFGLDASNVGMLFAVLGASAVVTQIFLLKRITSSIGERPAVILGLSMVAAGLVAMPFVPAHIAFLYIAATIAGFGSAISRPIITALISKESTRGMGVTMGIANTFESLGRLIGPILAGLLFSLHISLPFVFSAVVILAVLGFVIGRENFLKKS